ncbi:putative Serine protein kinase [Paramyrothecium foliicola]|nr:putative Serine protein kinase [Paramyrothecium foliicola]
MKIKALKKSFTNVSELLRLDSDELVERYRAMSTDNLQRLEIHYLRSYLANYSSAVFGVSTAFKTFGASIPVPVFSARMGYVARAKLELIQLELVGRSVQLRYPTWKDAGHILAGVVSGQVIGDWFSGQVENLLSVPVDGVVDEVVNENTGGKEIQAEILRAAPGEVIQAAYLAAVDGPPPSTCPRPRRNKFQRFKCAACATHFDTSYTEWVHCCQCSEKYDLCYDCSQTAKHDPEHQLYRMQGKRPKAQSSFRRFLGFDLDCDVCEESLLDEYYRHITTAAPAEARQHVTQLLDDFEHKGPNGTHICLVFEPMGPSVNSMVEELPQFNPRLRGMKVRYPPQMARAILKQSLQALAFIHKNGVAHGDFQPGNLLFCLSELDKQPEDALRQEEDSQGTSTSPPLQRLDGKMDKWAPKYLCISQPLAAFTPYTDGLKIKLSDMGGAYFFSNPPIKIVTPLGLRSPELVLAGNINEKLDIWSFGCILFEIITGSPLFCIPDLEGRDDDHLLALIATLGPLPDDLFKLWANSSLYFTPERKLFNCQIGGVSSGEEPLLVEQLTMEELFDQAAPEISEEEAKEIKQLIRRILTYDPMERPTAAEILSDPWFQKIGSGNY